MSIDIFWQFLLMISVNDAIDIKSIDWYQVSPLQKFSFLENGNIDKILVSNMIFSGEKSYKFFIGYMDNFCNIWPFSLTLPKASTYLKVMKRKLNGCIF